MKEPFWAKKNKGRWEQLKFNTLTLMSIEARYGELHCEYCGQKKLRVYQWNEKAKRENAATADHFYPKSEYPDLALEQDNMVVACMPCNEKKDNKEPNVEDIKYPRDANLIPNLLNLKRKPD